MHACTTLSDGILRCVAIYNYIACYSYNILNGVRQSVRDYAYGTASYSIAYQGVATLQLHTPCMAVHAIIRITT